MIDSLREHWRKYVTVALAFVLAITAVYQSGSSAIRRLDLYAESILHLSPGNVRQPKSVPPKVLAEERPPYIGSETKVVIIPLDKNKTINEVVRFEYSNIGFTFSPGIQVTALPPGVGIDIKWFHFYRLGSSAGINYFKFHGTDSASPSIGLTYCPFNSLSNTDIIFGYSPLGGIPFYGGIRIKL